jgi:hypothetical protein
LTQPVASPVTVAVPKYRGKAPASSALGRWMEAGQRLDSHDHGEERPWYRVLWLTGVDYFSTLGYQPGIALLAAGAISPLATLALVGVTLFCALPVYAQVASRSFAGQGSIAMLEHLLKGWRSKLIVLVLLGFAGTDFIITMTLSAADAAQHAVENPFLHPYLHGQQILLTLGLLALLAVVFLRGFKEAIGLATLIAVPYMVLNTVVLVRGLVEIAAHPELISNWRMDLAGRGDVTGLLIASALIFPRLALGLSGYETGVSVMPLISGGGGGVPGRVRATRRMLGSAALMMCVLLLLSSFVTTLLVPPAAYADGGKASGRAIAYLAHELLGVGFGSVYDFSTILILWFAGASAMAGLLHLVPRYLPRFGMAPRWTVHSRPLVLVLFGACVAVTLIFRANVEAQAGAYATGVLVLMMSAALAVSLALWSEGKAAKSVRLRALSAYFWLVTAVFGYTLADNVISRPDGLVIGSIFIGAIVLLGALSRFWRSTELRVDKLEFSDAGSEALWPSLVGKRVNLVPMRAGTPEGRRHKAEELRKHYAIKGPIAFLHVSLPDNRSEFFAHLKLSVRREEGDVVIEVSGAVAIANTIAYLSEMLDPISLFLGLTRQNQMSQALRYLLWGEGETGLLVYAILLRYWEWTPEDDVRPLIFMMSE